MSEKKYCTCESPQLEQAGDCPAGNWWTQCSVCKLRPKTETAVQRANPDDYLDKPGNRAPNRRNRVIMVEPNHRYDLTTAEQYGKVVFLSTAVLNPFRTGATTTTIMKGLEELQFNPDEDYFVLAGYVLTLSITLASIIAKYGRAEILMYEARTGSYVARTFDPTRSLTQEDHDSSTPESSRPAVA